MADILIKGLALPKDKNMMIEIRPSGIAFFKNNPNELPSWTTAIELPSHGDLIDRNALPIIGITDYMNEGHTVVEFEDVLNAPVIVEANNDM